MTKLKERLQRARKQEKQQEKLQKSKRRLQCESTPDVIGKLRSELRK